MTYSGLSYVDWQANLDRVETCKWCGGLGKIEQGTESNYAKCPECNGVGYFEPYKCVDSDATGYKE